MATSRHKSKHRRHFGTSATIILVLTIAMIACAGIYGYKFISSTSPQSDLRNAEKTGPSARDDNHQAVNLNVAQARETLPHQITEDATLTDIHYDEDAGMYYITIELSPLNFSSSITRMRSIAQAAMGGPDAPEACLENGDVAPSITPTMFEFKTASDGNIYRTIGAEEILCR